jgi:cellulose biosynthesis protein BcsQ
MHVIAVASQKGGSGKTTLAGHIAVQAELAGAGPVAVVDTDPQGSLSDWCRSDAGLHAHIGIEPARGPETSPRA